MAKKSTNKTILTVTLAAILIFAAISIIPKLLKGVKASSGSGGAGGAGGSSPSDYYPPQQQSGRSGMSMGMGSGSGSGSGSGYGSQINASYGKYAVQNLLGLSALSSEKLADYSAADSTEKYLPTFSDADLADMQKQSDATLAGIQSEMASLDDSILQSRTTLTPSAFPIGSTFADWWQTMVGESPALDPNIPAYFISPADNAASYSSAANTDLGYNDGMSFADWGGGYNNGQNDSGGGEQSDQSLSLSDVSISADEN